MLIVRESGARQGRTCGWHAALLAPALLIAMSGGAAWAQVDFMSADLFTVGDTPSGVVTGLFNDDALVDLAVANRDANSVQVLLNSGLGLFLPQTAVNVGLRPFALAAADFNADGELDLAVAVLGEDRVAILLGDGDGTFAAPTFADTGDTPTELAVGNIDGINGLDLVTANEEADSVTVLLNAGNGTFTPVSGGDISVVLQAATRSRPKDVALADFNGDGDLDLAAALFAQRSAVVLLGNGDGTFGQPTAFETGPAGVDTDPWALEAADLNGDGRQDLVVGNSRTDDVGVLLGDGTGSFTLAGPFAAGNRVEAVAVARVNDNNVPDVITANREGDSVSVLLGAGDGTLGAATRFTVLGGPSSVATGDFNGDGRLDLVATSEERDQIAVLLAGTDANGDVPQLPQCGGCGAMGVLPFLFTLLGLVQMKRQVRRW